jgi:predicted alpha/beta hydrolase family esterase
MSRVRIILVHGWGGRPDAGWLAWLNKEVSSRGYEFISLNMPDPENPKIVEWVSYLDKQVKNPDKNTYFIGHSIGCQTILRYIEKLPEKTKIGGAIFVAGWLTLNLETKEEEKIAKPWLQTPINFNKIKGKIGKSMALFSSDDPYVPLLENSGFFKEKLGGKIIIEKNKGHYIENVTKTIPIVLKELIEMIK